MALISDSARFVFVHIPKTGGTSVRAALANHATDRYFERSPVTKHLRAREVLSQHPSVPFDDYFTFAIARNPYDLLVSFWTYKMENPFHPDYVNVARLGSFTAWAEQHVRQPGMAQTCFTHDETGNQLVDDVGRFEDLGSDFATIAAKLGGDVGELRHENASSRRPSDDMITPQLREIVADAWSDDFANFGYDPQV